MTDHDDLTDRLAQLGSAPVPADVRDGHLHAMQAAAPAPEARRRFGKLAVAAAALVGFVAGSTGFAMAGALPDPAQRVAHDVLSVVQVNVPDRPENHGLCVSTAARNKDLPPEERQLEKDNCKESHRPGRPGKGGAPGRTGDTPGRPARAGEHPNARLDDCRGKPPWAGPGMTEDERAAAREQHLADCPQRGADADDAADAQADVNATPAPEGDTGS